MIYIRKTDESDRPLIEKWLASDEFHQSVGVAIEDIYAPGTEIAMVCDDDGPVMLLRLSLALRAGVQFGLSPYRSAKAGAAVRDWLKELALKSNANEVIVKAGGRAVNFVEHLGFVPFEGQVLKCR